MVGEDYENAEAERKKNHVTLLEVVRRSSRSGPHASQAGGRTVPAYVSFDQHDSFVAKYAPHTRVTYTSFTNIALPQDAELV